MINSYICVDIETTGLNAKEERIIEIGAVKVVDGEIVDRFHSFLQPGKPIGAHIEALTGITDKVLEGAPIASVVMPKFYAFCGDLPLLGHNLMFDYSFLKKGMVNEKIAFEKEGIDTLRIARKYLTELESRKLEFLCRYFGIKHTAHRALGDAEATHALYQKLCVLFAEKDEIEGANVFLPKPLLYNVKKEQAITISQKEQIKRYCQKLGIVLNRDLDLMTRAEASRFLQKYRLAYKEQE